VTTDPASNPPHQTTRRTQRNQRTHPTEHTPSNPPGQPVRRRRRGRSRYWLRRLIVLLILLLPVAAWQAWSFWRSLPVTAEGAAPRVVKGQPVYVAIMGVDEREHDKGRSDTLLLARLDPNRQALDIVQIPRDTRVTLEGGQHYKINAAYATGGPERVTQVVSDFLGVPRPYYVTINFDAFVDLVNAVDGVDIDVPQHYVYDDPYQNLHINIPAGRQHLMGETALHYVRLRYDGVTNSDIARIGRQQQFLEALKAKLTSPYYLARAKGLVDVVKRHVRTNIPEADQLMLLEALIKARDQVSMTMLPGTPDDASGDWLVDWQQWNEVKSRWQNR
jgi:LCP family protein required for cell wall assembly